MPLEPLEVQERLKVETLPGFDPEGAGLASLEVSLEVSLQVSFQYI